MSQPSEPRRIWKAVCEWFSDEWWFLKRCVLYHSILRHDYDFDSSDLLDLMEFKLRLMVRYFREDGHIADAGRCAREMERAAAVCKRLSDDNYLMSDYHTENWQGEWTGRKWEDPLMRERSIRRVVDRKTRTVKNVSHGDEMMVQDIAYFNRLFRRVRHWWD